MQGRRVPFAPLGFQRFAGPHQNLDALSLGLQQEPAPPADWGVPSADPDMEHFDELMQGIQAYQPPTMMAPSRQSQQVQQRPDLRHILQMQQELPLWFGKDDWATRVWRQPMKPYQGHR